MAKKSKSAKSAADIVAAASKPSAAKGRKASGSKGRKVVRHGSIASSLMSRSTIGFVGALGAASYLSERFPDTELVGEGWSWTNGGVSGRLVAAAAGAALVHFGKAGSYTGDVKAVSAGLAASWLTDKLGTWGATAGAKAAVEAAPTTSGFDESGAIIARNLRFDANADGRLSPKERRLANLTRQVQKLRGEVGIPAGGRRAAIAAPGMVTVPLNAVKPGYLALMAG